MNKKKFITTFVMCVALTSMFCACDNEKGNEIKNPSEQETSTSPITPSTPESTRGFEKGHEWVDLGLPSGILWATCNIGATYPYEFGDYFAWGEIETKSDYSETNYKHYNGNEKKITKYCNNTDWGNYGYMDNKTELDLDDDAAHVHWEGKWHIPTKDNCIELVDCCTWSWKAAGEDGYALAGYEVIGPNGNTIFLPAAGFRRGTELEYAGRNGTYWSSTLNSNSDRPNHAHTLGYNTSNSPSIPPRVAAGFRTTGRTIRPVCSK